MGRRVSVWSRAAARCACFVHNAAVITVLGVPAHPLLVHAVVVLIPLAGLGAVALAIRPSWTRPYGPLVGAAALGGAVSANLALLAGQQLEAALDITPAFAPLIAQHSLFGTYTVYAAWTFAVLAVAAVVLTYRPRGAAGRVVGALSAAVGVVAIVLTVITGHLGASSVWGPVVS